MKSSRRQRSASTRSPSRLLTQTGIAAFADIETVFHHSQKIGRRLQNSRSMPLHNFNPNTARGFGWVPPPSPSPHVLVLLLYLEATETWNYDALMSLFDDSLQHWTLPRSLNRPLLNKRQYGEYVKSVRPTFSTFKVPGISLPHRL